MQSDVVAQITAQGHDELRPIVCQILADEGTPIGEVTATKIGVSAGQATAGIFQVTGQARTQSGETGWRAVVKVLGSPELARHGPAHNPFRELEVYRSGAFADVCGGVRAAHCYAIQPRDDFQLLWLEDLSDAPQPPWSPDLFIETARHLGLFNAHWPEQRLPAWDWLDHYGFRAGFTGNNHYQQVFEQLPTLQDHPLMRRYTPPAAAQALMQLWEACDSLLSRVEETSKGICHLDCHSKNLFPIRVSGGDSYTVGIDWAHVGIANLGIDIGHLLASPLKWLEITPDEARSLRDPVFDAYLAGLVEAGWTGNHDEIRLTYLTRIACEAIRETNLVSESIKREGWAQLVEKSFKHSINDICARFSANLEFQVACIDEASQLMERL